MKQRLGIAVAMIGRPELVILDEPANALDPAGIVEIPKLLRRLPDMGTTVLVFDESDLPGHQGRLAFAALAVERRAISHGDLADIIWDGAPPSGVA